MRLDVTERVFKLRRPLQTSFGKVAKRRIFEVRLRDGDLVGRGEAGALEPYDGVTDRQVRRALRAYRRVVAGFDAASTGNLVEECRGVADLPQAFAAIDIARWDIEAQRAGKPIAELLADAPLPAVRCNAIADTLDEAAAAQSAGFDCVKVKVGRDADPLRAALFRAVLDPETLLRLDANGAWDVETAVAMIDRMAGVGIDLVEEPVHGIEELRAVRDRVPIRIAMDETASVPGALASGATDVVCLKVSRAGGISGLLAQAALVRSTGAEVYLASTFDGPIGIRAAAHCAAALRCELPCGLASLSLFKGFPAQPPAIAIGDQAGLG